MSLFTALARSARRITNRLTRSADEGAIPLRSGDETSAQDSIYAFESDLSRAAGVDELRTAPANDAPLMRSEDVARGQAVMVEEGAGRTIRRLGDLEPGDTVTRAPGDVNPQSIQRVLDDHDTGQDLYVGDP